MLPLKYCLVFGTLLIALKLTNADQNLERALPNIEEVASLTPGGPLTTLAAASTLTGTTSKLTNPSAAQTSTGQTLSNNNVNLRSTTDGDDNSDGDDQKTKSYHEEDYHYELNEPQHPPPVSHQQTYHTPSQHHYHQPDETLPPPVHTPPHYHQPAGSLSPPVHSPPQYFHPPPPPPFYRNRDFFYRNRFAQAPTAAEWPGALSPAHFFQSLPPPPPLPPSRWFPNYFSRDYHNLEDTHRMDTPPPRASTTSDLSGGIPTALLSYLPQAAHYQTAMESVQSRQPDEIKEIYGHQDHISGGRQVLKI